MRVTVAPPSSATDPDAIARLVEIVNSAYASAEAGMWREGTPRVTREEMCAIVADGELLVASDGDHVVGCVRLHQIDARTWGFGMLATDEHRRRAGTGRALVDAVEVMAQAAAGSTMQLELLVPLAYPQPSKVMLHRWYSRLGYVETRTISLAADHPELASRLLVDCEFQLWQKDLMPSDHAERTGPATGRR